jgi:hypothetical protein
MSGIPQSGSLDIVWKSHVVDIRRIFDFCHDGHYQLVSINVFLEYRFGKAEREFRKGHLRSDLNRAVAFRALR